jgi:hypothetical protein
MLSNQAVLVDLAVAHGQAADLVVLVLLAKVTMVVELPPAVLVFIAVPEAVVPELLEPVTFLAKLEQVVLGCSRQ